MTSNPYLSALGKMEIYQVEGAMASSVEFLVSKSGQMSVPAEVRRRWGLSDGGRVTVFDLGDAVVLLPAGSSQGLLRDALTADEHRALVESLDDADLATK
jgi:AbrB family looped-hinge helix DNA binding protein